jgi:hypothetical protein
MVTPFRRYKAQVEWIDESTREPQSRMMVFNLFDVAEWTTLDNKYEGFNDWIERTQLTLRSRQLIFIRVPFTDFDQVMNDFFKDNRLLDDRSSPIEEVYVAKYRYKGMMDSKFAGDKYSLSTNFFPKGVNPANMDEALRNVLYSNVTPYN